MSFLNCHSGGEGLHENNYSHVWLSGTPANKDAEKEVFSSTVNWSVKLLGKEPKMLAYGGEEQEKMSAE